MTTVGPIPSGPVIAAVTVLQLHRSWAWVVIVANGLVGLWGVGAQWTSRLRGRPYWVSTAVAQAFIGVQVVLGLVVYAQGLRPPSFHIFYGVFLVVGPTLVWVYRSEPGLRRWLYLFYGVAGLFFMGLAIRAMLTVTAG